MPNVYSYIHVTINDDKTSKLDLWVPELGQSMRPACIRGSLRRAGRV